MDTVVKQNIRNRLLNLFGRKTVSHTAFWVLVFLLLVSLDGTNQGPFFTFILELINVVFFAGVVYFNLLYLVPKFLTEKFLTYCFFLILLVTIITPIKIFIIFMLFSYFPEAQAKLVTDQYWLFLSTFLIAGGSTVFKIVTDWLKYQRDRKELQTRTMQSELKFLKSQINPHFLFNTLNNLYALTLKKSDKAPEIVIKLSEMMRYMLYECNEKRVLLSKEVNYLRNYLDLEKLRQGKNVKIDFHVNGHIGDQRIAPLMFIPFLENSFKHGLHNQISQGFVNIVMEVSDRKVHFFIENSKAETLPAQTHRRSGGIGLVNVKRRLNLLYPEHYQLNIHDNPKTYSIELDIELD